MTIRILLILGLLFGLLQLTKAQQVAKGLHQMLISEEENPTRLYVKIGTSNIEVKKTVGSRLRVSGKVKISIPNLYFLEHLIKQGRYTLTLTPSGNGGLHLEDKARTPIILKGEKCREDLFFTIYVPETITSVIVENTLTGHSNVISLKE